MNGMGGLTITHPAGLIQAQASATWDTVTIQPHGAPDAQDGVASGDRRRRAL
jgi:hypothetical protein